jgi:hypothetical protein
MWFVSRLLPIYVVRVDHFKIITGLSHQAAQHIVGVTQHSRYRCRSAFTLITLAALTANPSEYLIGTQPIVI